MGERKLHPSAWLIAITAGLGGPLLACSKEEPPPASPASATAARAGEVFRFAPPDGTEFVRTDRRSEEVAVVGAPLRQIETDELRWRTRVAREGDAYRIDQDLVYLSYSRDGETLLQGEVPKGISATLHIDPRGELTSINGLERTAETLRSLVTPGQEAVAEKLFTAESLSDVVASRYKILFGETIGRPSAPGSSWKLSHPPGSFVTSRTVTVTGHEPCGETICARLQVTFELDPKVVADTAVGIVGSSLGGAGEAPEQATVKSADYRMSGWMLLEPATMLSHGASLTEGGTVTVADADNKAITIELKGTTELSYSYTHGRTSANSTPVESRVATD
jgi:hypothetical protein